MKSITIWNYLPQNNDLHIIIWNCSFWQAMNYLHESPLKCHGHLQSRTCAIDNRWALKICDLGSGNFRQIAVNDDVNAVESRRLNYNGVYLALTRTLTTGIESIAYHISTACPVIIYYPLIEEALSQCQNQGSGWRLADCTPCTSAGPWRVVLQTCCGRRPSCWGFPLRPLGARRAATCTASRSSCSRSSTGRGRSSTSIQKVPSYRCSQRALIVRERWLHQWKLVM